MVNKSLPLRWARAAANAIAAARERTPPAIDAEVATLVNKEMAREVGDIAAAVESIDAGATADQKAEEAAKAAGVKVEPKPAKADAKAGA